MAEGQALFFKKGSGEAAWSEIERIGLPEQGARVLSVGCGDAPLLRLIARKRPHWRLTGIDLCAGSLAKACMLAGEQRSGIDFLQVDVYALPFEDGAFDLVYAREVWPQLVDRETAMREMRRVVNEQGCVMIFG